MSPKINNIGFESHGHVQKSRYHKNEGFSSSPMMKSKRYYRRRRELGGQHAFHIASATKKKVHCTPQLIFNRHVIFFVVFETPIFPATEKTMVF